MTNIWVASDHHFGHNNILKFTDDSGELIRGKVFKTIEEHDTKIIDWHNELVRSEDHVYFLGDVVINKKFLSYIKFMNGHKRLVRGNHDIFKTQQYLDAGFNEIYGVRVWPKHGYIFSHVPLHPDCLRSRNWKNIHGHLHQGWVRLPEGTTDGRYTNVSLEHTNYRPHLLMI